MPETVAASGLAVYEFAVEVAGIAPATSLASDRFGSVSHVNGDFAIIGAAGALILIPSEVIARKRRNRR